MSRLEGVDVASFQGPPGQWVNTAGRIAWAAVKLTEVSLGGTYVNPDAGADWQWLKSNGKGRIAYLYAHPGTDPAVSVATFMTELHRLGLDDADGIAVDLEETDGQSPAQVSDWAHQVLAGLQSAAGRLPLLYTYLSFAEAGNCAGLGRYPLWMSDPSSPPGHPRVPPPWKTWAIHQWSTSSPIDRDLAAWQNPAYMAGVLGRAGAVVVRPRRKPVRRVVKKAVHGTRKTVRREPVVTAAGASGALSAAVALLAGRAGIHLTATQLAAVLTALPALATIFAALRVDKKPFTAVMGSLGTIGTAALAFGVHMPASYIGASAPFVTSVILALTRSQVSPVAAPDPVMVPAAAVPAPAVPVS
jgi:hypothetical protein